MRAELKHLHRDLGRTLVYVTHDQIEAMTMPDRVAVLREGVIQQVETPENVYHRPVNRFVATVVGSPPMNFIPCTVETRNGVLRASHSLFDVEVATRGVELRETLPDGTPCLLGVRPEDVHVDAAGGGGFEATVYATEPLGGETVVDLAVGDRVVKALAPPTLKLRQDERVGVRFDAQRMHLFAGSGEALLSAAGADIFAVAIARPA
jgi:multiple sugar transport system ATP-binding protein